MPLIAFVCFAVLCVAIVFHSLTQYIDPDEEQYLTGAYLARHLRLYTDFLYLQPPIYPLVLSKLLLLFSGVSPFLIARLFSAALGIGSVIVFFELAWRLSKSKRVAAVLVFLFASTPLMLLAFGSARNDIMPIFFGLVGVWFTLHGLDTVREQSDGYLAFFWAGVCMALAVGAKVTAAFIPLCAMLYIFLRAKLGLLPLILGGALGSLPIVYYAATAFDKFVYCIATFHLTMPREFFTRVGMAEIFTWPYRMRIMLLTWAHEPALVVAVLFMVLVAFIAWRRGTVFEIKRKQLLADRTFIILLTVAAIPFVFLPNHPPGKHYLQPAVPYLLLSCAVFYPLAQRIVERRQMFLVGTTAVAVLILQIGQFVGVGLQRLNSSLWTVTEVHDLSALIARHVEKGAVATPFPALVLDGGSQIYPEFATGVFFFRSGNHLAPERVLELNGVSTGTLPILLSARPPAAVFIGSSSDRPLLHWAQRNCYIEVDLAQWRGRPYHEEIWKPRLFVRPPERGPCGDG